LKSGDWTKLPYCEFIPPDEPSAISFCCGAPCSGIDELAQGRDDVYNHPLLKYGG